MHPIEESTTTQVYKPDPMHQTGKYIQSDADALLTATQTFWNDYQMVASNTILPQSLQMALITFMHTCEQPLYDLLTKRSSIGTTLSSAATQVVELEDRLQSSFTPTV